MKVWGLVFACLATVFALVGYYVYSPIASFAELRAGGYCTALKQRLTDAQHIENAIAFEDSAKPDFMFFRDIDDESNDSKLGFRKALTAYVKKNPDCCFIERPRTDPPNSDNYNVFAGTRTGFLSRAITSKTRIMVVLRFPAMEKTDGRAIAGIYHSLQLHDQCGGKIKIGGYLSKEYGGQRLCKLMRRSGCEGVGIIESVVSASHSDGRDIM